MSRPWRTMKVRAIDSSWSGCRAEVVLGRYSERTAAVNESHRDNPGRAALPNPLELRATSRVRRPGTHAMSCEDGRQGRSPLGVRVSSMRRVLACFFALTAALPALVPLAATAASGAPGCASRPAPADGGYEELASVLEPLRQKYNLPALGAAVVTPDGVKALGVVGIRKYGDTTPACVEDAFHLGSDTKAMTAVVGTRPPFGHHCAGPGLRQRHPRPAPRPPERPGA